MAKQVTVVWVERDLATTRSAVASVLEGRARLRDLPLRGLKAADEGWTFTTKTTMRSWPQKWSIVLELHQPGITRMRIKGSVAQFSSYGTLESYTHELTMAITRELGAAMWICQRKRCNTMILGTDGETRPCGCGTPLFRQVRYMDPQPVSPMRPWVPPAP